MAQILDKNGHEKTRIYASASGKTLAFNDCVFDFSLNSDPPPQGQKIVQALLAQNAVLATLQLGT